MKQTCEHHFLDNAGRLLCAQTGDDCYGPDCPAAGCIKGYTFDSPHPVDDSQFGPHEGVDWSEVYREKRLAKMRPEDR